MEGAAGSFDRIRHRRSRRLAGERSRRPRAVSLAGPPRRGDPDGRPGPGAFDVSPDRFAERALGALPGFKAPLEPGKPKRFKGTPLDAVETTASGIQAGGLEERATLIVLRRDHLVNYTVAVLENAEHPGSELDRVVALRMVETLRDLPPKGAGGQ